MFGDIGNTFGANISSKKEEMNHALAGGVADDVT
jgi:hypothetical protein